MVSILLWYTVMSYSTSYQMLKAAKDGNYAIGAFNAENMEMIKAIISAAEELKAPVIIQTTPGTINYGTLETYHSIVYSEAIRASIPVCLHLDHGNSFSLAAAAIKVGYSSVMIDGSKLTFDENINLTKKVVEMGKACNIPVEAELGKVGGKEDDMTDSGTGYTDPDEALTFVEKTDIDSLAIGIGTAHGVYKIKPVLNKKRIAEVREKVSVPLVLHGASGLSDEDVRECIKKGMCKVNFATELRQAYTDACKTLIKEKPEIFDPKKFGIVAMEAVKAQVKYRIKICGCDFKA